MRIKRTKNTIKGSVWGLVNQIVSLLFPFILRTCIISTFGIKYVGLGSLFTSILSVLSLAELGVGSAIVYSMYAPIAEDDDKKICALLNLYRKVYRITGLVILFVGTILLPFLNHFINDTVPDGLNVYVLYCIYLINSVASYWVFAYKSSLLAAFQRNDIVSKISVSLHAIMYGIQMFAVVYAKDYYLYILCMPVMTISINLATSFIVDRKYPQYKCDGRLESNEIQEIKKQVAGLLSQRLAHKSRNALDNIIISSFLGLTMVAIYGNYFYVINALTGFLAVFLTAMQGGLGNSIAKDSQEKTYDDFLKINFLYMWIAGWSTVCFTILVQPFMRAWVGNDSLFNIDIVILLAFYFYAMKSADIVATYISATGLWWRCKWVYFLEAIINLLLNICLGYYFGIYGIIIATIISVIFVNYIMTTYIIYKYYFTNMCIKKYMIENAYYLLATTISTAGSCYLVDKGYKFMNLMAGDLLEFLIKSLLCVIIPNVLFFALYCHTVRYRQTKEWLLEKLRNRGAR